MIRNVQFRKVKEMFCLFAEDSVGDKSGTRGESNVRGAQHPGPGQEHGSEGLDYALGLPALQQHVGVLRQPLAVPPPGRLPHQSPHRPV